MISTGSAAVCRGRQRLARGKEKAVSLSMGRFWLLQRVFAWACVCLIVPESVCCVCVDLRGGLYGGRRRYHRLEGPQLLLRLSCLMQLPGAMLRSHCPKRQSSVLSSLLVRSRVISAESKGRGHAIVQLHSQATTPRAHSPSSTTTTPSPPPRRRQLLPPPPPSPPPLPSIS